MSSKHKTETSSVETQPAGLTATQRDKQKAKKKAKKKAKQGSVELRAKKKAAKAKGKQAKDKKAKKPRCTAWCPAYDGEFQQPWWVHPELHCTKKAGHTYQHHDKTNGWNWDDVYFE